MNGLFAVVYWPNKKFELLNGHYGPPLRFDTQKEAQDYIDKQYGNERIGPYSDESDLFGIVKIIS